MAATANIVLSPYSYLINGKFRGGLKTLRWTNAVLIFDEAHNLEVYHDSLYQCCYMHSQVMPVLVVLLMHQLQEVQQICI